MKQILRIIMKFVSIYMLISEQKSHTNSWTEYICFVIYLNHITVCKRTFCFTPFRSKSTAAHEYNFVDIYENGYYSLTSHISPIICSKMSRMYCIFT
jgi:hypothetical protein